MKSLLTHLLVAALAALTLPAGAQDRIKLRAPSLMLPVVNPIIVNVMKEKSFDAKHGLDVEVKPYPSISAFYAGLATGEIDTLIGGATVL